jgi:hypothetical protein
MKLFALLSTCSIAVSLLCGNLCPAQDSSQKPWVWPRPAMGTIETLVLLKCDGTCLSPYPQMHAEVKDWTNVVSLSAGRLHVLGMKRDGTCLATSGMKSAIGAPLPGTTAVVDWKNLVAIAGGVNHSVGLREDGTVLVAGSFPKALEVAQWKDIVAIGAGDGFTIGVRRDGTCVAAGNDKHGQCDVQHWKDIITVACGIGNTIGLRSDGTVVSTILIPATIMQQKGQCAVGNWCEVIDIYGSSGALRRDGTVLFTGFDHWNVSNALQWKDIISSSMGQINYAGVKKDGSVVFSGRNISNEIDKTIKGYNMGPVAEITAPRVPTGRSIREPWPPAGWKPTPAPAPVPPGTNPRFRDNKNGTVTDTLTGLIWLKDLTSLSKSCSWKDAEQTCKTFAAGAAGLTDGSKPGDWRLPTRLELESLLTDTPQLTADLEKHVNEWAKGRFTDRSNTPAVPACTPALPPGHPFIGVQPKSYWSSSISNVNGVWCVYLSAGVAIHESKTNGYHVWPVRGR